MKRLAAQGVIVPDDGRYDLLPDVLKQLSENVGDHVALASPSGKPLLIEPADWAEAESYE